MNSSQRAEARTALVNVGFKRTGYTDDIDARGDYTETWEHADGTVITINWAERENRTPGDRWRTALDAVLDRQEPPVPRPDDYSGSISPETLAKATEEIQAVPVESAPGMYDEPDEGLSFPLGKSDEEDTIR